MCTFSHIRTRTLPHSHSTHMHSDTHTYRPLLGFCVVFCLKTRRKYWRVEGSRWRESKGALLLGDGSTGSPYLNANSKHQVVCSRDERSHGQGPEKVLVPEDSWLLLSFSLNNKNHKKKFIWTTEIALLYRIIFIILIIMGLYLMKLGSNWERKVPRKYMVIRTFKISIQNLVGKRGKEVRAAP